METIGTPEITDVTLSTISSRFVAFCLDLVVLFLPAGLLQLGVPFAGPLLLGFFYFPVLHASPMQATLGKKVMRIKVTDSLGNRLSISMAILRYVVAAASGALFFLGHLVAFFSKRHQAVHDLVADSIVVNGENSDVKFTDAWLGSLQRLFGAGQDAFDRFQAEVPRAYKKRRYDEIERLFELHQKGALTDQEYQRLKSELLADKTK